MGGVLGCALRVLNLGDDVIEVIHFPGELFVRVLQLMLIPSITCSLVSSLGTLDRKQLKKIGSLTLGYYLFTAISAAIIGQLNHYDTRTGKLHFSQAA